MTVATSITPRPKVNLPHHRIHEGNFFSTHTISTGLMVANPKQFLFISPSAIPQPLTFDTVKVHLIFIISCDLGVTIELFEDTVVSNNGTAIPVISQNRNSMTPPLGQVFEDPTVTANGTFLLSQIIGSTTTGGTGGLVNRDEQELILKVGTNYLLRITPLVDGVNITTHFKGYDARPSAPIPIPGISNS